MTGFAQVFSLTGAEPTYRIFAERLVRRAGERKTLFIVEHLSFIILRGERTISLRRGGRTDNGCHRPSYRDASCRSGGLFEADPSGREGRSRTAGGTSQSIRPSQNRRAFGSDRKGDRR